MVILQMCIYGRRIRMNLVHEVTILLIRDAHTHSLGPSVTLIAAHRGILSPYIPLANCARIAMPRSRVTLDIAS